MNTANGTQEPLEPDNQAMAQEVARQLKQQQIADQMEAARVNGMTANTLHFAEPVSAYYNALVANGLEMPAATMLTQQYQAALLSSVGLFVRQQ